MLLASKISAAILLAALRLLAGLLPLKVYRKLDKWGRQPQEDGNKVTGAISGRQTKIDLLLSVFLCFGAGLLFSTCFVHMIPEVGNTLSPPAVSYAGVNDSCYLARSASRSTRQQEVAIGLILTPFPLLKLSSAWGSSPSIY